MGGLVLCSEDAIIVVYYSIEHLQCNLVHK